MFFVDGQRTENHLSAEKNSPMESKEPLHLDYHEYGIEKTEKSLKYVVAL